MRACVRDVGRGARDPGAVCASQFRKLSPARQRAWEAWAKNPTLIPYDEFKTGMSFPEVRRMLWVNSDDPKDWRHKGRHSVLGLWHELKQKQYDVYERQNEPRENPRRSAPMGQHARLRVADPNHPNRAIGGIWHVVKRLPRGRVIVQGPGGKMLNVDRSKLVFRNPALPESVRRAASEYEKFHWGEKPRTATRMKAPIPKGALYVLGDLPSIPYRTKKGGDRDTWEHEFEGPRKPKVAVDEAGELFVLRNGSRYRIRPEGIKG